MENLIFYFCIFCMGTVFGSFFTLAVYRIPLHQNITHKRSYCPNCKHKLGFFDMIPILSYIFLGGKCRYCKNKIRIRYLILEIVSGIVFVLIAMGIRIDILNMQQDKLAYLVFVFLYIAGIIIIAGIDKEKRTISKSVMLYEIVILSLYMIYLYIVENTNIYRYVIYLFVISALLVLDIWHLKTKFKDAYYINIMILCIIIGGFTYEAYFIYTAIITLLAIAFTIILEKIINMKNKYRVKEKKYADNLPIGFYLCTSNIIVLIVMNMILLGGVQ